MSLVTTCDLDEGVNLKANEVKVDFLVLLDGSEDQGEGGVILEQSMELGIHPKDEKVFEA